MIALGSAYENHLERQQRRRDKVPSNNNEANNKLSSPLDKIHGDIPRRGHSDSDISTSDSFRGMFGVSEWALY